MYVFTYLLTSDEQLVRMLSSADVALTNNAHSETGQMAVCCQNLTLGALSSRSALSVLIGALYKKFGLSLTRLVWRCGPIAM
jgi:uncharacterized MnhB-related membrane protein